jgi:hypothetical protein
MNKFIKFPAMWQQVLMEQQATSAEWRMALWLLGKARFCPLVKVTNVAMARIRISHATKWRALNRLAQWSLIRFEKMRAGSSPIVQVKWLAGRQPSG